MSKVVEISPMTADHFTTAAITRELQNAVACHTSSSLYPYGSAEGEQTGLKGVYPLASG